MTNTWNVIKKEGIHNSLMKNYTEEWYLFSIMWSYTLYIIYTYLSQSCHKLQEINGTSFLPLKWTAFSFFHSNVINIYTSIQGLHNLLQKEVTLVFTRCTDCLLILTTSEKQSEKHTLLLSSLLHIIKVKYIHSIIIISAKLNEYIPLFVYRLFLIWLYC